MDHRLVTCQLYFEGGDHLHKPVAQAVKPALVLRPRPAESGPAESGPGPRVTYDFALDPQ